MIDFRMAPHRVIAGKNIVEVVLDGNVVATIAAKGPWRNAAASSVSSFSSPSKLPVISSDSGPSQLRLKPAPISR